MLFNIFKKKMPYADVVRSGYVGSGGRVITLPAEPPSEECWGEYICIENPDDKEELLRRCEFLFDDTMKELKRAVLKDPEKYFIIKRKSADNLLSENTVGFKVSVRIKR